jgi:acyl-CoA synthetase (AMP-forming)/AMP-acid ligase II
MNNEPPSAPDHLVAPNWYAAATPDVPAIVMGSSGTTVTYAQLNDRSRRFARFLRSQGLRLGDHVAIMLPNNRAFLEIAWAAQRAGLYYTAINTHLRPGEVQYVLKDCGASALISSETLPEVAGLDFSRIPVRVSTDGGLPGFECYEDVIAVQSPELLDDECEGREMLYSSGTTGRPKGVRKPLLGATFGDPTTVLAEIAYGLTFGNSGSGSVFLCPAPLYHSAPLVGSMSWQRFGATVVLMEKFDPRECLRLIERYRITDAQLVPTMFTRLLSLPRAERERYDVSSLRHVTHTAAPCPVALKRQMIEWWGPIIDEYYSGTEDIGATFISAREWLEHPGSVGRPLVRCHIVGPDGAECPPGEAGVVYFEGGRSFDYHNDPDKTASVRNDLGWRTLGDIGYLDDEGYLYLTDRQAHMIISGGVNIYPQEAENVLAGHPAVVDVAVIGVPDDEMGEAVKAVVQLAETIVPTEELKNELIAYCRAELASYKCPRSVDFVDDLPRDPNGKLYKRLVRERYWAGHQSRIV